VRRFEKTTSPYERLGDLIECEIPQIISFGIFSTPNKLSAWRITWLWLLDSLPSSSLWQRVGLNGPQIWHVAALPILPFEWLQFSFSQMSSLFRLFVDGPAELLDTPRILRSSLFNCSICSLMAAAHFSWLGVMSSMFMTSVASILTA
jgi:hypothetical protein